MMERKFTDDEIVRALECCCNNEDCIGCPCLDHGCYYEVQYSLDLINRQKAEMERLEVELKAMRGAANSYKAEAERLREAYALYEETTGLKWARAEAIKEFAERLHKIRETNGQRGYGRVIYREDIVDLVKEMTGKHNG